MASVWKITSVFLFLTLLAPSLAKLKYCMKPCPRNAVDLNECVLTMVGDAMSYIVKGRSEFGKFDALPQSSLTANLHNNGLSLNIIGKEVVWRGLETAAISNFKFDLNAMKMSFNLRFPTMTVDATCSAVGYMLGEEIHADGERYPYSTLHTTTEGFIGDFNFNLALMTNATGTFLVPTLSSYDKQLGIAKLSLENIFRPGYEPGGHMLTLINKLKETLKDTVWELQSKLISQMVPVATSTIMAKHTYDQMFPESSVLPIPEYDADCVSSAPTMTVGWLSATISSLCMAALMTKCLTL